MVVKDILSECLYRVSKMPIHLWDKPGFPVCIRRIKTHAVYWSIVSAITVFFLNEQTVYAADIWSKFSDMMKDIYTKLLGISTIVGVTAASVALLIRMISRNQRAVDEATGWLKRIIVTWVVLNCLGFVVAYLQPLVAGGKYNP